MLDGSLDNLTRLRYFVKVAETLHFTKAAELLGIAQPALSQQIGRLERELGIKLFDRTNRRIRLTGAGEMVLIRARFLLRQVNAIQAEILEFQGLQRGVARIGSSGTITAFLLPELLVEFRKLYPDIDIELAQRPSNSILEMVEQGQLDVGLVRLPVRPTSLPLTRLSSQRLCVAIRAEHPLAAQEEISPGDLAGENFILTVHRSEPFCDLVIKLCADSGFAPNIILYGADFVTAMRLAGMGIGVCIVSELAAQIKVEPSPIFRPIAHRDASTTVAVVHVAEELMPPAAKVFLRLTLDRVGQS